MDWYRLSFAHVADGAEKITLDLRNVHICVIGGVCANTPVTPMPGIFPTLATATLWSSLGFAAFIAFQAGARVLAGNASDSLSKLGYMFALLTISLVVATAYMCSPDPEGPDRARRAHGNRVAPGVGSADVERVAARCPEARLDPATRQFIEIGQAAALPDLEALRAHDERLA
jgi:hypothetical protein